MRKFELHRHYFRVTYHDSDRAMPEIEVFAYIGTNLSDEDSEDTAYFQFVDSIAEQAALGKSAQVPRRVTEVTEQIEGDMLTLDELVLRLRKSQERFEQLQKK
jgi:hypothetical protein